MKNDPYFKSGSPTGSGRRLSSDSGRAEVIG